MDNPIDAIVDIDRTAREKVAAAQEKAEKILADALAKKKSMTNDNSSKIGAETDAKFAALREKTDADIARCNAEADEKCRLLDEKMNAERTAWKKEIIARILG